MYRRSFSGLRLMMQAGGEEDVHTSPRRSGLGDAVRYLEYSSTEPLSEEEIPTCSCIPSMTVSKPMGVSLCEV